MTSPNWHWSLTRKTSSLTLKFSVRWAIADQSINQKLSEISNLCRHGADSWWTWRQRICCFL